jgi:hypothetical protein
VFRRDSEASDFLQVGEKRVRVVNESYSESQLAR